MEMLNQKWLVYLSSLKDQTCARIKKTDGRQEGNKVEFLILSVPMQERCPSFQKEQETVEQAECLKYMTKVI